MRKLLPFIVIFLLSPAWTSAAQDEVERATSTLNQIEKSLKKGTGTESQFKDWTRTLTDISINAEECSQKNRDMISKLTQDLESLGEADKKEPREVASKRQELEKQRQTAENSLASCKVLLLRSGEMNAEISEQLKLLLAERLFARGTPTYEILKKNIGQYELWLDAIRLFFAQSWVGAEFDIKAGLGLLMLLLLSTAFGFLIRKNTPVWLAPVSWGRTFSSRLLLSALSTLGYYAPYLLLTSCSALFFTLMADETKPLPLLYGISLGLPVFVLLYVLSEVFLIPRRPAEAFLPVDDSLARALVKRLKVLAVLLLVGYALFTAIFMQQASEAAYLLMRSGYVVLLAIHLSWVVWLLGRNAPTSLGRWIRLLSYGLVLLVLIAEWAGYRNLSSLAARALSGSLIVIAALMVSSRLVQDFFEGVDQGQLRVHRMIRRWLGVQAEQHVPGLVWLHVLTVLALWVSAAFAMLHIWGVSAAFIEQLVLYFTEGFVIGSLQIIPLRILIALVTFAVLLSVSGWFKNRLEHRWLPRTRIERGTREAMVIISGYVGVAVALLVGLGITGVEFTSLAIIAGALSVGIGFGLQNIVNNFISGLILLFERPIKTGDWIVVGNTEGYVKRIRIRSTQIQTFDRADVIVPNSELISSQVTNWMLQDARGRAKIPIGVAYGSDTEKVKQILLDLAAAHPSVISYDDNLKPKVMFLSFGDSALHFELRCYIRNIDERLQFISDMNFAIEKAFRENGIGIPFPQRDLHIKNWPGRDKDSEV